MPTLLADSVADTRRTNAWDSVPTEPTEQLVEAPVHMAVVTWKAPVLFSRTGEERVCWAIVIHTKSGGHKVKTGETTVERPMPFIVTDVLAAVAEYSQPVWVVVSKKRVPLSVALHDAGIPVTRGITDENRAAARALTIGSTLPSRAYDVAYQNGWRPVVEQDEVEESVDITENSRAVESVDYEPLWWPLLGYETQTHHRHLIIATDASAGWDSLAAISAVSIDGSGRLESLPNNCSIGELEFEAIILALRLATRAGAEEVTILSDSLGAVAVASAIISGLPPRGGYHGIGQSLRDRFAEAAAQIDGRLRVLKVKGHNGHRLNEIADQTAVLGRLASRFDRNDVIVELHLRVSELWAQARHLSPADIPVVDQTRSYVCSEPNPDEWITGLIPASELVTDTRLTHSIGDALRGKFAFAN